MLEVDLLLVDHNRISSCQPAWTTPRDIPYIMFTAKTRTKTSQSLLSLISHGTEKTHTVVLIPQTRVCSRTSRDYRSSVGNMSGRGRRAEFRIGPWIRVRRTISSPRTASQLLSRRRSQIYKRGYVFRRGPLVIQMFQQEQVRRPFVCFPRDTVLMKAS